ncbi:hypothetical protein EDD11_007348, partial [Mortierella claussenii]
MSSLQQPVQGTGTSAAANVLDCDSVLQLLQALLPQRNSGTGSHALEEGLSTSTSTTEPTTSSSTFLSNPYEGLAALSHAMMTAVGFRLVGLGEDDTLSVDHKSIDDLSKANALPERWNASKESYSFRYTHSNSQLTYLVKCMRLAGKLVIHGTTLETSKICSLEIEVKDFTSASYYPYTTATDVTKDPLWNAFLSRSRINDLIAQFKVRVIQQLIPGLSKPGYQEETQPSTSTANTTAGRPTSTGSASGPVTGEDRRGYPPGVYPDDPSGFPGIGGLPGRPGFVPRPPIFGDPFSAEDPHFGELGGGSAFNPFEIGRSDLDPFGGRIGGIGGFGGGFGGGMGGVGGSGGGMVVGPNHPMFRRPPPGGHRGQSGIFGGPRPLPRGSVPPGARFDPIGPFNLAGGVGGSGTPGAGSAHGLGTAGRGSTSGEPDNDEAPPPGYMD